MQARLPPSSFVPIPSTSPAPSLKSAGDFSSPYRQFNTIVLKMPSQTKRQISTTKAVEDQAAPDKPIRPSPTSAQQSRGKLIAVAEVLFAERSVDSVSMVEIGLAAGQKNRSAVQYHFGDKSGILQAIRLKHLPLIEARRIQMLDTLEASPQATLRDFVDALVSPLAQELLNPDGGAAYVRIAASLIGHREFSPLASERRAQETAARLFSHIARNSHALPNRSIGERMLVVAGMVFHGLADWVRLPANQDSVDPAALNQFADDLTNCVVSVLATPASTARD